MILTAHPLWGRPEHFISAKFSGDEEADRGRTRSNQGADPAGNLVAS